MTVANTDGRGSVQLSNGENRVWSFDFLVVDPAHVKLELRDAVSNALLEEVTSGFFVSGINRPEGGGVTFPPDNEPPLPSGYAVVVVRNVPYGQPYRFTNQGGMFPEDVEKALDFLAMQIMQLRDRLDGQE